MSASFVIIRKSDGEVVWEVFSAEMGAAINLTRYAVMPIGEYLGSLNRAISLNSEQGRS